MDVHRIHRRGDYVALRGTFDRRAARAGALRCAGTCKSVTYERKVNGLQAWEDRCSDEGGAKDGDVPHCSGFGWWLEISMVTESTEE